MYSIGQTVKYTFMGETRVGTIENIVYENNTTYYKFTDYEYMSPEKNIVGIYTYFVQQSLSNKYDRMSDIQLKFSPEEPMVINTGSRVININNRKTGTVTGLRNDSYEMEVRMDNPMGYHYIVDYDGTFETYESHMFLRLL